MISFIWKSWKRQKERFILLMVGALLISTGLSFLMGLSETNKGTIVSTLQNKWSASYDIVVRPAGIKSNTEEESLLDPNYLSGISGGISLKDYETIKNLADIEVAAPISILGYQSYQVTFGKKTYTEPGIYRFTYEFKENDGVSDYQVKRDLYISIGHTPPSFNNGDNPYGITSVGREQPLASGNYFLLAAIDPVEEAKLVGLDQAISKKLDSRYFTPDDVPEVDINKEYNEKTVNLPVMISNKSNYNQTTTYTFERLDLPFNDKEAAESTFNLIQENGGVKYLEGVKGLNKEVFSYNDDQEHDLLIQSLSGIDVSTGKTAPQEKRNAVQLDMGLRYQSSPLVNQLVQSPFPDRWKLSYELVPFSGKYDSSYPMYRKPVEFKPQGLNFININPEFIGFYDPSKLSISMDPTTELPMETYRTPSAKLVIDQMGQPVNPPKDIVPTSNPFGYMLAPPTMLTTIEAASNILGDKPISAIRLKVRGVDSLSSESQQKLKKIANEIENKTGLITDITLGSSPQPLLIHIPKVENSGTSGWIEQPWIKIGASINIFKETKLGYSGITFCVILAAIIYVFSTNLVSFLSRKKEFAILLAIGWRPEKIRKLLWTESLILGSFVSVLAAIVSILLKWNSPDAINGIAFVLMVFCIFFIYIIGAIAPIIMSNKIKPYQVMREGEISASRKRIIPTKGLSSFVINNLLGRWKRNILSILAIALPTTLLMLFLFVSLRLNGILFTTWLGQYVSMEVGVPHYVAMAVSLFIAVITTSEIMWQNISERRPEIALLKAIGWKNSSIRAMVLLEGSLTGLFGGILGIVIAFILISGMYGKIPSSELWIILIGVIPVVFGLIAAWLPSINAAKIDPAEGVRGSYQGKNLNV